MSVYRCLCVSGLLFGHAVTETNRVYLAQSHSGGGSYHHCVFVGFQDRLRFISRRKQAHRIFPETGSCCSGRSVVPATRKNKKAGNPDSGFATVGCVVGIVSVVLIAKAMGASREIIYSLAPKSVTTPIAIEVSKAIHGIPPLTASVVIVVGIFGGIFGYTIMKWTRVKNPVAQGLSMGTAAHAVGTSRSMEISPTFGAMSSIGLIVNGIFTAILTPYILQLINIWISL